MSKPTLAQRFSEAMKPVKHIKEAINHNSEILETLSDSIKAQRSDYVALQKMVMTMANRLTVIEAGTGHMLENADWMKAIIDSQSDTMMLIHNFGWLMKNSDDFWRDALNDVTPELFYSVFTKLNETRQRELMPELFLSQED